MAIDRATRWVFLRIYAGQDEDSSVNFLQRLHEACPDENRQGAHRQRQFTDRFTSKLRKPMGRHKFDVRCRALGIEHRTCRATHRPTAWWSASTAAAAR